MWWPHRQIPEGQEKHLFTTARAQDTPETASGLLVAGATRPGATGGSLPRWRQHGSGRKSPPGPRVHGVSLGKPSITHTSVSSPAKWVQQPHLGCDLKGLHQDSVSHSALHRPWHTGLLSLLLSLFLPQTSDRTSSRQLTVPLSSPLPSSGGSSRQGWRASGTGPGQWWRQGLSEAPCPRVSSDGGLCKPLPQPHSTWGPLTVGALRVEAPARDWVRSWLARLPLPETG